MSYYKTPNKLGDKGGTETRRVPNEGMITKSLELERELPKRRAPREHALLEAPPNCLLKTIMNAS